MRSRQVFWTAAVIGAALSLVSFSPARGDLSFFTSEGAYQSALSALGLSDKNVLFNSNLIKGPATLVQGDLQTGEIIDFIGTEDLLAKDAGGQVEIQANDGGLNHLEITPDDPTKSFVALTADPKFAPGGNPSAFAEITVLSQNQAFNYNLGNGNNFFGVIATNGQSFTSVLIDTFTDSTKLQREDIDHVEHVRVLFEPVPEPIFYQLGALLGLGGIGMLRLRRKAAK